MTSKCRAPNIWAIKNCSQGHQSLRGFPPFFNPLPPGYAARKQKKIILDDLFSSVLSHFKKYHCSENLKFIYLGIFQSFKLRIRGSLQFSFVTF